MPSSAATRVPVLKLLVWEGRVVVGVGVGWRAGKAQLVVYWVCCPTWCGVLGLILLWASGRGDFPLELAQFLTPFPKTLSNESKHTHIHTHTHKYPHQDTHMGVCTQTHTHTHTNTQGSHLREKNCVFLRKKGAGYANLKMPCVYSTQKTVTSHIKMRLVFSFFAPSREGL